MNQSAELSNENPRIDKLLKLLFALSRAEGEDRLMV